ncbi:LysR substrate-binding domain-containing protein [Actinomycetospora corticicola]|uniref:DNA-binding transcriptional LysR family regulator n=1 Tax=Actinomycetospora corticicola TaxID=663602 RepID=A0A7Y9J7U9_9PSEU|nr:LysR substrate-binding domain-containing protein [Actinomycetospora corticicola]NYD38887.1 DNA-binding transcriptional LysR family regulator [Actinomycetospora corticicola]
MDLRQLRYFVTVARTRHFGRAAEQLHIAQSPLSQAIRQLESHLGAPLFERTTRRVDLTPAGEALLPEAVRILESVSAARDQVSRVAAGDLGSLRVGATGLATYRHVPGLVRRLSEHLPGLALTFRTELLTPDLEAALADHRIDLAVLRPPVRDESLRTHLLAREGLVLAEPVPTSGGAADDGPVDLADLADADFVVYAAPGSVVGAAADRACRAAGFVPRHTHEAGQTSTVLALVAAGLGVALLPESVLAVTVEGVRFRPLAHTGVTTDVALAWRSDDPSPALARALTVLLEEHRP